MPNVYKITFPSGKIYVGSDLTDSVAYTGSLCEEALRADAPIREGATFTFLKEILWFRPEATKSETCLEEHRWIKRLESNNPSVGYNRSPKYRSK